MHLSTLGRASFYQNPVARYVEGIIAAYLLLLSLSFLYYLVGYTYNVLAAQRWVQAQAIVTQLSAREDDADAVDYGGDFLNLAYQFEVDGQTFHGEQMTLAGNRRFLKSMLNSRVGELELAMQNQQAVDCYYDPHDPNRNALERRPLAQVFIVRTFGFFGCFIGGFFLMRLAMDDFRRRRRLSRVQTLHPQEPWRVRDDWASGCIRSSSRFDSWILVGGSILYLIVVLPLGLWWNHEIDGKLFSWLGIGLLVLAWGALNLIRMRWSSRFLDQSQLQLGAVPGVIGGPLYGSIRMTKMNRPMSDIQVSLECLQIKKVDESSRDTSSINETVLHREVLALNSMLNSDDPGQSLIPLYFVVPFDSPDSSADSNPSIHWLVKVGREGGAGLGEYAQFEVPVFTTPESSADFVSNAEIMDPFKAPVALSQLLQRVGVTQQQDASGCQQIAISSFSRSMLATGLATATVLAVVTIALFVAGYAWWSIFPAMMLGMIVVAVTSKLLWRCELSTDMRTLTVTSGFPWRKEKMNVAPGQHCGWVFDVEAEMKETSLYQIRVWTQEMTQEMTQEILEEESSEIGSDRDATAEEDVAFLIHYIQIVRDLRSVDEAKVLIEWLSEKTGIAAAAPPGETTESATGPV